MSLETSAENTNAKIEEALNLAPTEFRCIDESVPMTGLTDDDLLLRDLGIKVEALLHLKLGHAMHVGTPTATPEEVQQFRDILKGKVIQYDAYFNLLGEISS